MVKEPPVGGRGSVVELVDHHNVEGVGRHGGHVVGRQRLDRGEDVAPALGARAGEVFLAKGGIRQNLAVRTQRLLQNLTSVSDEQQRGHFFAALGCRLTEPAIVERGNHRLTGACGRDDKVAVPSMHLAFHVDRLEDLGLIRPGSYLETSEGDRDSVGSLPAGCLCKRVF